MTQQNCWRGDGEASSGKGEPIGHLGAVGDQRVSSRTDSLLKDEAYGEPKTQNEALRAMVLVALFPAYASLWSGSHFMCWPSLSMALTPEQRKHSRPKTRSARWKA